MGLRLGPAPSKRLHDRIGSELLLIMSNHVMSAAQEVIANPAWTVSIIAPDGGTVRAASGDSAGLFVDAVALPAGTYTLVVDPEAELTGPAAVRLYTVTDVKRVMTIGGPAQTEIGAI